MGSQPIASTAEVNLVKLEQDVAEILDILRPLRPLIEQAPEFMAEVGPFIQKLQSNPLLKGFLR